MKNILTWAVTTILIWFLAFIAATAQDHKQERVLAYMSTEANTSTIMFKSTENVAGEIVDYPTISYPETASFSVEKEKAFYHLSWQVIMRENLSYTEIQSSSDGVNFTTVGFVMNDGSQKNMGFDYFVPSDKSNTTSFRLIQYGMNARNHVSEVYRIQ